MFRRPKPGTGRTRACTMSCADGRMTSKSCVQSSFGRTVQTQAAAAATIGDAKLVPLYLSYWPGGRDRDSGPDAVAGRREVDVWRAARIERRPAFWSVAPTVRTCGALAGYSSGLPAAGVTGGRHDQDPALCATATILSRSGFLTC